MNQNPNNFRMSPRPNRSSFTLVNKGIPFLVACFLMWGTSVFGYVLDWNAQSWTYGNTSKTFVNLNGSGVDVTVTISGNTGNFVSGYPRITNPSSGGFGGGYPNNVSDNLELFVNHSSTSQSITVSVTFSQEVENVSFSLFDLDRGTKNKGEYAYIDQVANVKASLNGGSDFGATASFNTGYIDVAGSGTTAEYYGSQIAVDNASGNANLGLSFGSSLNKFSYVYGNRDTGGNKTQANPDQQGIGFYDISFTKVGPVVPEPSTVFSLAGIGLVIFWRQRKGWVQLLNRHLLH